MTAHSAPSIPKAPAERTFVVAVTVLSLAAVVQIIAVAVALAPQIDLQKIGRSFAARPAGESAAVAPATADDVSKARQANAFIEEAQQFRSQGNFSGAVQAVTEADHLVPGKPGIMIQIGFDLAQIGRNAEAIAVFNRILALPPSNDPADAPFREKARSALAQLGAPAAPATAGAPAANVAPDEVGIPIGSVMGIVKSELLDAEPGQKNLRVATKAAAGKAIDSQKFVATVFFYEQGDDGEVQQNDSPHVTEWLSLPATWTNGEPEIFQTKYRLPPTDRGDLPPLQYYGYVVGIYYDGELQAVRAEPVALLDKFPPPLHKPE